MPIDAQQAWDATNPADTNENREKAAANIMAGTAANDAYLSSRSELEQIIAKASGVQIPPVHPDSTSTVGTSATGGTVTGADPTAGSIAGTVATDDAQYPETNTVAGSPRLGDHYRIVARDGRLFHVYPDMGSGAEQVYEIKRDETLTTLPTTGSSEAMVS